MVYYDQKHIIFPCRFLLPPSVLECSFNLCRLRGITNRSMPEVGELSTHPEDLNLTKRFDLPATTEFVSVTSIEPMEDFQADVASLKLSFEETEQISASVPCTVDSSDTARSMLKKKTSFAENLKVISIFSDNVATTAKPESVEFIDADRSEVDANLSEQVSS
ncbi:hypothetical protein AHF37_07536 [Paragonimus kellicotti]|nr:hypothetical protein AHF37_07536 [Paragonimus kellicotti]